MQGPRSQAAFARAERVLVGGVNSPVRAFKGVGGAPVVLASAKGAHVVDVDGRSYVDLVGSFGPAIAGHAHPAVVEAVAAAAARGLSFGACCEAEAELAELVLAALPGHDKLRCVNSGTEAVMSSVRLARAATGRRKVVKFEGCYHGHMDAMLVAAGSGAETLGVPDSAGVTPATAADTLIAPYNDADAVVRLFQAHPGEVAAVLVEPIAGNMGLVPPAEGYLAGLRELTRAAGALLIFDEVMTGFRVAYGGAQSLYGVTPDLTMLGKVIGGGLPAAAYGGRKDLMEQIAPAGPIYQAGTLSGNPVGMAAGITTLRLCAESGFYDRLSARTEALVAGLRDVGAEVGVPLSADSLGGMAGFFFRGAMPKDLTEARQADHGLFARFFRSMLQHGVWLPPSGYEAIFVSAAHTEADVAHVIEATRKALQEVTR
jgi:glutamate-1-semialdehyde 2,1-aminomutase